VRGETVPPSITAKLDRAIHLIDEADGSVPKKGKRLRKHARAVLALADRSLRKASRGKKRS
jgi:hypothetical protein